MKQNILVYALEINKSVMLRDERRKFLLEYMGTKEASEKWGYKQSTISAMCRDGAIEGAEQDAKGSPWRIPVDTPNPRTQRMLLKKKEKQ